MTRVSAVPRPVTTLRLVRPGEPGSNPTLRVDGGRPGTPSGPLRRAVGEENRRAAGLDPSDAPWVLAVRASQLIQGGRAAVLTPERRQRLVAEARSMGLRAFDAALVIAIVQDAARRGDPLSGEAEGRLALVPPAAPASAWAGVGLAAVSVVIGLGLAAAGAAWLVG